MNERRYTSLLHRRYKVCLALVCMAVVLLLQTMPVKAAPRVLGSQPSGTSQPAIGNEGEQNSEPASETPEGGGEEQTPEANGGETPNPGDNGENAGAAATTVVTSATVTQGSVNVRSDASTSSAIAGKATQGMEVGVTGEKTGSDGNVWYEVSFENNGTAVTGYIRSDLVEPHETVVEPEPPAPVESEAAPVEPEPAPTPTDDYYVQYMDDGTGAGVNAWFLVDNTMGNSYPIAELLSAQENAQNSQGEAEKLVGTLRIVIVVMAVVLLLLIVTVTILIIKRNNSEYDDGYDDEDDEEEDDEEDEEDEDDERPARGRSRRAVRRPRYEEDNDEEEDEEEDDDDEDDEPPRRPSPRRSVSKRKPAGRRRYEEDEEDDDEEDEEDEEAYRPRRSSKASKGSKNKNWQSKNFLDDDDLEFEFLDLK